MNGSHSQKSPPSFVQVARSDHPERKGTRDPMSSVERERGIKEHMEQQQLDAQPPHQLWPTRISELRLERGSDGNVGIAFRREFDNPYKVTGVLPGGPADRARLVKGDEIHFVDTVPVRGKGAEELKALLRGAPGSAVTLGVCREHGDPKQGGTRASSHRLSAPPPPSTDSAREALRHGRRMPESKSVSPPRTRTSPTTARSLSFEQRAESPLPRRSMLDQTPSPQRLRPPNLSPGSSFYNSSVPSSLNASASARGNFDAYHQ